MVIPWFKIQETTDLPRTTSTELNCLKSVKIKRLCFKKKIENPNV